MPIATPAQFRQMLKAAQDGGYAYPAINTTSIMTLNAAMKGFVETKSDGIISSQLAPGVSPRGWPTRTWPTVASSWPKPPTSWPSSTMFLSP